MNKPVIKVGVGACTVGRAVRYNGEAKRKNEFLARFGQHVELVPVCPEVGIGMGVPRETIRLVMRESGEMTIRDSETQTKDYTSELKNYAAGTLQKYPGLCGYILVKGSPTCGKERVKVYNEKGNIQHQQGMGIFAATLQQLDPNLPIEEDGRLNDVGLRENFVTRVYVYHDWQQLMAGGINSKRLLAFYARYKYLVMAHHVPTYKQIGPLLANAGNRDPQELGFEVISLMMQGLSRPVTRKGYTNAMQHIRGYLKRELATDEKRDIDKAIEQYRDGIVPLVVPMNLLQYQFNRHPDAYIADQVIMQPYPEELGLRNAI